MGRISRGFDFLGYDFSPTGITGMSRRTVEKFAKRVAQLYEQGADDVGIGQYVRRWLRWTTAGLDGRVRWKEPGYPVGCESVIGRFLPDLLSLRDPGGLWSRPSINHLTPTLISLSGKGMARNRGDKKTAPEHIRGGLNFLSVGLKPAGRPAGQSLMRDGGAAEPVRQEPGDSSSPVRGRHRPGMHSPAVR